MRIRVGHYLTAEANELLARHRRLGTIDVLVQYLRVFDGVLTAAPYGHDVVERSCLRRQQPSGQGAAILLQFQQS